MKVNLVVEHPSQRRHEQDSTLIGDLARDQGINAAPGFDVSVQLGCNEDGDLAGGNDVDYGHPYLAERGLGVDTAREFGVGFCAGSGVMRGRVIIPVHDNRGRLLAYAGCAIDGTEPKYRWSQEFDTSRVLFNLGRAGRLQDSLIVVVEDFFDCMSVQQAGFPCVALMGSSMSEIQERLLAKFERVYLMFDSNIAAQETCEAIAGRISRWMYVREVKICRVPTHKSRDHLSKDEIIAALSCC